MATLSSETHTRADGSTTRTWRVLVGGGRQPRRTIRLGKISQRAAQAARDRIDALESAQRSGQAIDSQTAAWLAKISDDIYERLAKAGLVEPRHAAESWTLSRFLETYIDGRDDVKPNTVIAYNRTRRQLVEFFGRSRKIDTIHEGDADDFKQWLLRKSAVASASRDIVRSRQFFKAAMRRRLIAANPFADVKAGSQTNASRKHFVPREDIDAVIAACPDNDWRLIFAFARYAGLRIPSELDTLRWADINWERGRFVVHVAKKAHIPGHETRVVPIFPKLRPHLERAFAEAEPGSVYVVPRARGCPNLRRYAEQILRRAGVKQWPKLFNNCRASCETELVRQHPAHVVHSWIGHTASVAEDHYLQTTDEDFERAIYPAQNPAQSGASRGRQEPSRETENRVFLGKYDDSGAIQYPRQETNKASFSREIGESHDPPGTYPGTTDAGLADLIAAWPHLPAETREAILALAHTPADRS